MTKIAKPFVCAFALAVIWLASGCGGNMPMAQPTPTPAPVPSISTISPSGIFFPGGTTPFTLTVNGANFEPGSIIIWNGIVHSTSFVNASQLTASISGSDIFNNLPQCTLCVLKVSVVNPSGIGSNQVDFTVEIMI